MKTLFLVIVTSSLLITGCSTTTNLNLKATYPEYIEKELNKVEKDKDVGVGISLLLNDGSKYNGELISVRESTIILCTEYSAKEEKLAKLEYPIAIIRNDEIRELTIEGSNWVWEGIAAGAIVGGIAYWSGHAIKTYSSQGEHDEGKNLYGIIFGICIAGGWGIGYALSTEEYVLQEVPNDYNWSILKPLARYPDKEPEYLRAME